MDNGLIFNLLNTIIRKEKEGQTISPEQYSELLQMGSWEKANSDYSFFERDQIITDSLRSLKDNESVTIALGVGDISSLTDYWHATNASHAITGYPIVPIDIVSDVEYQARSFSDLEKPGEMWPILKIVDDTLLVNPSTITSIDFEYLKNPNVPYFDYYIDADDKIQYLTEGQVYTLLANETYTDKEDGSVLTVGETIGVKPAQDANNMSIEMSFPPGERVQVLYIILSKLGISLNEQDAVEYGLLREQKEQAE